MADVYDPLIENNQAALMPEEPVGTNTVLAPQEPLVQPATTQDSMQEVGQDLISGVTAGIPGMEDSTFEAPAPKAPTPQEEFEAARSRLQNMLASQTQHGISLRTPTDEEVLDFMDQEETEKAAQAQQEAANLDARIQRRMELMSRAASKGIKIAEDPELDPIIKERSALQKSVTAPPSEKEVDSKADEIRQNLASVEAEKRVRTQKLEHEVKKEEAIKNQIKSEDEEIAKIDPNRMWTNKSVGDKILASIAIALGGIGAGLTGGKNTALELLQREIDRDIEAQKLNISTALAKKQHAYKGLELRLQAEASRTDNELKRAKIAQLMGAARQEQESILKKRIMYKAIEAGKVADPSLIREKDQKRIVRMQDGTIRLADNEKAATEVRNFQSQVIPAINGAKRILETSNNSSKFNFKDRAKISTELKALVGQLRIPFTGPGILTDKEYERLLDTVGNPNKLFSLPTLERLKIRTVIKKLNKDLNQTYKIAGITAPKGPNEIDIKKLKKANPGLSEEKIENALRKSALKKYGKRVKPEL